MPKNEEFSCEISNMIQMQLRRRGITDAGVLAAMEFVPRHEFVPREFRRNSYDDVPLPIGHGQTISQPYIVAAMTAALHTSPAIALVDRKPVPVYERDRWASYAARRSSRRRYTVAKLFDRGRSVGAHHRKSFDENSRGTNSCRERIPLPQARQRR